MPFRTALSGLNAASANLRVIGNNVANASTTGFKESRAEFADVYASSSLGVSSTAIGSGVRVSNIAQQFSQGNIEFTDSNLDLAINGQGFYIVSDGGTNQYTRAGAFSVDRDGYVVNNNLQRLQVFQADVNGNITGALGDLQLDTSDIAPSATGESSPGVGGDGVNAVLNLDSNAAQLPAYTAVATSGTATTLGGLSVTDYQAGAAVSFNVDGNLVDLTTDLTNLAGIQAEIQSDLNGAAPGTYTVSNDGTNITISKVATGAASTAPVITAVAGPTVSEFTNVASVNGLSVGSTFDRNDPTTYSNSTSLTVYDSLGNPVLKTMYFRKTDNANEWEVHSWLTYTDNSGNRTEMEMPVAGGSAGEPATLQFNAQGQLVTANPAFGGAPSPIIDYDSNLLLDTSGALVGGTGALTTVTGGGALDFDVSFLGTTQFGSQFSVNSLTQDGYSSGRLRGVDIAGTGTIQARYTNGQSRILGQVALANFANAQGLNQLGDTSWAETFDSGSALIGAPGSSSLGVIQSGALEGSNTELTEQLVNMITAQRNFQANAQVITTADTVTQTIINIR